MSALTFQALRRLADGRFHSGETIARSLGRSRATLSEALKRRCEELLRQAEARVDKITTDANGQVTGTEPLDVQ